MSTIVTRGEKSAEELGELYARRWRVELHFDDIKTTMGMEMLRTKSPAMVCRELLMHMIAYNLVRAVVARSGADPAAASYKGTLDRIGAWQDMIRSAPGAKAAARMVGEMLETVAEDTVRERPGRREPRQVKRRPKPFDKLSKPRHQAMEIPHRSRYRKAA